MASSVIIGDLMMELVVVVFRLDYSAFGCFFVCV